MVPFLVNIHAFSSRVTPALAMIHIANHFRQKSHLRDP